MHKPVKYVEKGLTFVAKGAWHVFNTVNSIKPNEGFIPNWSEKPLLKSLQAGFVFTMRLGSEGEVNRLTCTAAAL